MVNELEQKARELLAAEYVRSGASERTARVSSESPNNDSAIRAIVAALQQAQQPGAQAVARTYRLATGEARIDFTEDRFRDLPPGTNLYTTQQPGAQAVAWQVRLIRNADGEVFQDWRNIPRELYEAEKSGSVGEVLRCEYRTLYTAPPPLPEGAQAVAIVGDDLYPGWVDDAPDLPPGTKLYAASPPLPEGVSEEDVDAALKVKWPLHYNVMSAARLAYERGYMRKILESYRARLAAKAGGDRAG